MAGFRVQTFNGVRPRDGAPLILACDKKEGLTLLSIRGSNRKVELKCDPTSAGLHKIDDGPRSNWTGRALGTWEVDVHHRGGVTSFRMRSKNDALALIFWIEKREKRRPKVVVEPVGRPSPSVEKGTSAISSVSSAEEYRAYLANLCYRLSYLRGRQAVWEVDAELSAIVEEIQGVLGR